MDLQMELTRRRIPYEVRSGLRFFEQAHIKDIISYLRAALNPLDEISWIRILKLTPGIGNITAKKIWEHLKSANNPLEFVESDIIIKHIPKRGRDSWKIFSGYMRCLRDDDISLHPSEAIRDILGAGYENYLKGNYENYEDRKEDIEQLSNYANNFKSTKEFLSDLALLTSVQSEDVVEPDEEGESIVLSTIHRAKGLEWSRVFILTRAKDELYLCYPIMDNRWYDGSVLKRPSMFIQELPEEIYEKWEVEE
jgi:DNA helicase-2/ATP-dependent DNA helicase PcrA